MRERFTLQDDSVFRRDIGLALFVIAGYAILSLWIPQRWALSLFQVATYAVGVVLVVRHYFRPTTLARSRIVMPLAGVAAWCGWQLVAGWTVCPWETLNSLLNWMTNTVLFVVALEAFAGERVRLWFLKAVLWFGSGLSILASVQSLTSAGKVFWLFPSGYDNDVMGPFIYRNQYAAFIELILPIGLFFMLRERSGTWRYLLMSAAMFVSVMVAGSRAGFLLMSAEVVAFVLVAWRQGHVSGRRLQWSLLKLAVVMLAFVAVLGGDRIWRRFSEPDPYATRWQMLRSSLEMIRDRPWTGFGLGTWATAYPAYAHYDDGTFVNQAHNDWAQWGVEGGIPVLLLCGAFALMTVRPALGCLWGIGLLSVWLHAFVDYPMQQRPGLAAFIFLMAALVWQAGWRAEPRVRMRTRTRLEPVMSVPECEVR